MRIRLQYLHINMPTAKVGYAHSPLKWAGQYYFGFYLITQNLQIRFGGRRMNSFNHLLSMFSSIYRILTLPGEYNRVRLTLAKTLGYRAIDVAKQSSPRGVWNLQMQMNYGIICKDDCRWVADGCRQGTDIGQRREYGTLEASRQCSIM